MQTDANVTIDCYDAEEYTTEDWPECLVTITDPDIPVPQEGDCIQFGCMVDEDGEELDRWHYNATNTDDASYEHSQFYRVVDRLLHYHNRREMNDNNTIVTDKAEVTVKLLVEEARDDENPYN